MSRIKAIRIVPLWLWLALFVSSANGQATGEGNMTGNEQVIREFISAWSRLDAAELAAYFTADGSYHNIPTAPVTGRENIERFIAGFIRNWDSTDWEVLNLFAAGNLVVAERIDHTIVAGGKVDLPVFGIFEMEDGKIKVWRDYFNMPTYTEALAKALDGAN